MKVKMKVDNIEMTVSGETRSQFTVQEAADYLGMVKATVMYHLNQGNLSHDFTIGKNLMFHRSTLDRFKAQKRKSGRPKQTRNRS